jgi:uncharacterized membrane protein
MAESKDKIIEARPLSVNTELEIELGRKMIYDSLTSVNDYAKFMIGFNGVIAGLYSGLLKLLPQASIQNLHPALLFLPVISFVISAIIFTMAYFPRMKRISLDRPSSILRAYKELTQEKMKMSQIGTAGFIFSVIIMTLILIFVIK